MPGKVCLDYNRVHKWMMLLWKLEVRIRRKNILIIKGVQASGVIIDRLLRQCCFVWSEIVGPPSSGNFKNKIRYEISMQENHISPCLELSSMNDTNQRGHGVQLKWYVTFGHWTKMLIFQAVIEDQLVHYELGSGSNDYLIWPGGKTGSEDTEWESRRLTSFCF